VYSENKKKNVNFDETDQKNNEESDVLMPKY